MRVERSGLYHDIMVLCNVSVVATAEEVVHVSRSVTNLLPFSTPEGSRCRLIPVLSELQECNYVTLQYKQVMTHAQPPL